MSQVAVQARDEALERVAARSGDFMLDGLRELGTYPGGYMLTGEDIRHELGRKGIRPHHHNAWGALVMAAVKRGILHGTDTYEAMTDPQSHGRRTRVYERTYKEA